MQKDTSGVKNSLNNTIVCTSTIEIRPAFSIMIRVTQRVGHALLLQLFESSVRRQAAATRLRIEHASQPDESRRFKHKGYGTGHRKE